MKKILPLFFLLSILLVSAFLPEGNEREKIDPQVLSRLSGSKTAAVLVLMEADTDLSAASAIRDKASKGQFVFSSLQKTAERSQAALRNWLDKKEITWQSFWIANLLAIETDEPTLLQIASRTDVKQIIANPWVQMETLPGWESEQTEFRGGSIEWGVEKINAPAVWELGYRGEGIVVGGQDTGYDWQHPALINKYRGWNGSDAVHDYNWHDAIHEINPLNGDSLALPENNPCGLDVTEPCDDDGHGTHTMGTMTGSDGDTEQIGVAPGAKWIACRNMERGWGKPSTYIECFEWFVAPTDLSGANPDPGMAPHVINNSWGCPLIEGCSATATELMETVVNNVRAAGIFVVVSAGNSGKNCGSIDDPAAIFESSFSIGATDSRDSITSFSSRGPVIYNGNTYLKPNVVAPGQSVRSSFPGGYYGRASGTSMAGPHVAGLVALLLNAVPSLAGNVDLIADVIEQSAMPLYSGDGCTEFPGSAHPNAVYGYGRVDALEAIKLAEAQVSDTDIANAGIALRVFPNPTSDYLVIESGKPEAKFKFELFDYSGRPQGVWNIRGSEVIQTAHLPRGLYVYRVRQEGAMIQSGKIFSINTKR